MQNKENNFDFTLYLDDNIIVSREFKVYGYNPKATKSLTFKYVVDDIMDTIKDYLWLKSSEVMSMNAELYKNDPNYDQNDFNETIMFTIKMNDNVIAQRSWEAKIYPASVRYSIDIRPYIYNIINSIQKTLCSKTNTLELSYLDYSLDV